VTPEIIKGTSSDGTKYYFVNINQYRNTFSACPLYIFYPKSFNSKMYSKDNLMTEVRERSIQNK